MSDGPEGCTSVEEWLAKGGTIKTEREHAVYEFTHEPREFIAAYIQTTTGQQQRLLYANWLEGTK